MLAREGAFAATNNQFTLELQVYEQIKITATKVWREIPSKGETSLDLISIHQSPDEPFQDFVAQLLQATGRIISILKLVS